MTPMADILAQIVAHKQDEIKQRQSVRPEQVLRQQAEQQDRVGKSFIHALQSKVSQGQPGVIAEIKKASPSKGILREDFDPVQIAQSYAQAGAACLSVLTDERFFQGHDDYLRQVRGACDLPLLRKDFIIDPYQIYEAKLLGADCILLIAACLSDQQLGDFSQLAAELGLDVLPEVHDMAELQRVLPLDTALIGINNRNLHTFVTRLETTYELLAEIEPRRTVVTESGIHLGEHVQQMQAHGVNCFLVGEAFMRAEEPGAALQALFAAP